MISVIYHELVATMSDPEYYSGWADANQQENADKVCMPGPSTLLMVKYCVPVRSSCNCMGYGIRMGSLRKY
jgi:hypothetical protein